ncbi:GNAT family N-acetyltransferase [Haloarchaeobius amylolyticus]|uniref:GNAT family N-acetyltransferase n=1 Tax=Haloarchaeobius amylolyticus TaxID=1198296 RepID=UPI00226F8622|nr:GNAT family protein [Haloarchaeobius amylolyticus]
MHLFPTAFETERLRYERLDETVDVFELYDVMSQEGFADTVEHISKSQHDTPKDTFDYLAESAEKWEEADRANWAMIPKAGEDGAGEFAGVASLIPLWDRRTARLGVWLREPFWGRGYSGERADALVDLAFDRLDLELVAAAHTDENEASKRAIEKYVDRWGGQYDGILRNWVVLDDEPRDLHRYTITREQYDEADVPVGLTVHEDGFE